MRKTLNTLIVSIMMILLGNLYSNILEVCLSGEKQFTSIQEAIDIANDGDTVRVYPGDYWGGIDMSGKSITIESLFATTNDTLTIYNTRLLTSYDEIVIIVSNSYLTNHSVTIDGFTISNNSDGFEPNCHYTDYHTIVKTGLFINNTNAEVKNNIVTQNLVSANGAIRFSAYREYRKSVYLENNKIFSNRGIGTWGDGGAGLYIGESIDVVFSEENRNSIYGNIASSGKDIMLLVTATPINIYLDIGSRILTEIDNNYIGLSAPFGLYPMSITVDILREYLPPFINQDLYVAPWGDDTNSGLNPSNPLKTLHYATSIIASDSINPKTIHLLPGIYTKEEGQVTPVFLPAYTKVLGSGIDVTVFEGFITTIFSYLTNEGEVEIDNLTIRNSGNRFLTAAIRGTAKIHKIVNVSLSDNFYRITLSFRSFNNAGNWTNDHSLSLKNIMIQNGYDMPMDIWCINNVNIENVIIDNINSSARSSGINIEEVPNILANNLSITNFNFTGYSVVLQTRLAYSVMPHTPIPNPQGIAVLNNVLIANNNTYDESDWNANFGTVNIYRESSKTILNNWTFANNTGDNVALTMSSPDITLNNIIMYNPEMMSEIRISPGSDHITKTVMNNSLIYNNRISMNNGNENNVLNNVFPDAPGFMGLFDESLPPDKWDYYFLHETSKAINAGNDVSDMMSDFDLNGNPRVYGEKIDLGAFEFQGDPVSIDDQVIVPIIEYNLNNYPNPVNLNRDRYTLISFDIQDKPQNEPMIEIYNIRGQKIKTLYVGTSFLDLAISAGLSTTNLDLISSRNYSAVWDIKDNNNRTVSSGVYFYRAIIDGKTIGTNRMIVIK